jgi:hypothetical protein
MVPNERKEMFNLKEYKVVIYQDQQYLPFGFDDGAGLMYIVD